MLSCTPLITPTWDLRIVKRDHALLPQTFMQLALSLNRRELAGQSEHPDNVQALIRNIGSIHNVLIHIIANI